MYTGKMLESMKRLEATRKERLGQEIPLLSPEDRQTLLEGFHPDYRDDIFRTIKVGPSKGERAPVEFVDIFEAYSAIDPEKFDREATIAPLREAVRNGGTLVTGHDGLAILDFFDLATEEEKELVRTRTEEFEEVLARAQVIADERRGGGS